VLIMSPVVIWNAQHGWVMIHHEGGHFGETRWSVTRALIFLAGQVGAMSPLVVLVGASLLRRLPAGEGPRLLWALSLGWLGFFLVKALTAKVQVNWPAPCYISLLILLSGSIADLPRWKRTTLFAGLGLALAVMVIAYLPYTFGLTSHQDPFKDTRAWRTPVRTLSAEAPPAAFILTPNYKVAAEVAFYWPRYVPVYVAGSAERRFNQHDLWPSIDREAGRNGLWVSTSPAAPPQLARAFAQCAPLPAVNAVTPDGKPLRTFYILDCRDYRPIRWPQPQSY